MQSAPSPLGVNVCFYPQPHQLIRAKTPNSCQKSVYIFDDYGIFFEDETGKDHSFTKIPIKLLAYSQQRDSLKEKYDIKRIDVVWNCKTFVWVKKIAEEVQRMKSDQNLFRVCWEQSYDIFDPQTLLDKIYYCPHDGKYRGLLEK